MAIDRTGLKGEQRRTVAIEEARQRRVARAEAKEARTEWFINEVSTKVRMHLRTRVKLAAEFLRDKIVQNISTPVVKATSMRTRRVVVLERSVRGEFPRADTTQLMKTLFSDVKEFAGGMVEGYVGTPLDYGVELELLMDRSFMVRTLNEQRMTVTAILTGPLK